MKQFGDTTVDNIKYFSSLENSKEYGMKQMLRASNYTYSQLQWLLQTDYGQQLLHQVEVYLTYSEDALDKYLPAVEGSEEQSKGNHKKYYIKLCKLNRSKILFIELIFLIHLITK